jgi:flagellar hook-associated protein 3 FlgL
MNRTLAEIDATQNHVLENRARIGMRLGAVARQMDVNEAYVLQLEQTTSLIRDLDYAEAAGRLQFQLTVLQAAQQSFANVQNISLFDYLR